jgi:hypothetical protein
LARLARLNPELQTDGRQHSISHEFLQCRSFSSATHLVCPKCKIGSADSSELQFFAAGIMSFAILRNLLLERERRAPPTDPYLVFVSLQHDFSMSKMFLLTVSNQQPQTSSENWDCKKVRRLGTHSKLEAIISTWCSSILSILEQKKCRKISATSKKQKKT